MADNFTYKQPASPDKTMRSVDIGGIQYQGCTINDPITGFGASVDSVSGGLGVDIVQAVALDVNSLPTINVNDVSGIISLPTGASTEATLSTLNGKVTACNTGAVIVASGVITTITNPVAVTGTFFQATQPVSIATMPTTPVTGTFWQATQPVSLAVNTPVIAAGSAIIGQVGIDQTTPGTTNLVAAGQNGTWTVQPGNTANTTAWLVTGTGGTFPVTGTFWQATQPVSGTFWQSTQPVSIASLPSLAAGSAVIGHVIVDAGSAVIGHVILDASSAVIGHTIVDSGTITSITNSVAVTGTFWQATQPVSVADGTAAISLTSSGTSTTLALNSAGVVAVVLTSLGTGGTIQFEGSVDNATWVSVNAMPVATGALVTSTAAAGSWVIDCAGLQAVRCRASALTSGTIAGTMRSSIAAGQISLASPLPAGTNAIGHVILDAGSAVVGHVIADASSAVIGHVIADASSAVIGHVIVDTAPSTAVTGTFWQATQPVSGTITASNTAGDVGSGSADSGNPVKIGFKALDMGTDPTAVAANQRVNSYANRAGIPYTIGGHPNSHTKEFSFTTSQSNVTLVTPASGKKVVVTGAQATVSHATSVDVGVRIGLATTTLSAASSSGVTGIVLSHAGIQAGGGVVVGNGGGILGIAAAANDLLLITSDAPTSGTLRVVVTWFECE